MLRPIPFLVCALFALTSASPARADEPQPVHRYSDDHRPPPSAKTQLILLGTAVTAGFYGAGVGASYLFPDAHGIDDLRLPVVGPWMAVGQTRLCNSEDTPPQNCSDVTRIIGAILMALDGVGQAGGLGLVLQGILLPTAPRSSQASARRLWYTTHASRISHVRKPLTFHSGDFEISARPTTIPGADFGFGLVGKF